MLFPLERLLEGRGIPLCVNHDTKVREALKLMVENDFSQLPVLDKNGNLSGIISEQTIVRYYYYVRGNVSLLDLTVDHCQTPPVTLVPESDLFEALDALKNVYAIVIVKGREPIGILTDYDASSFFRDLSEGLILVQDIELTLRRYIETVIPEEKAMVAALMLAFGPDRRDHSKPGREYDKMDFGDHIQLITADSNWPKFKGVFEPNELFFSLMDQVRDIRNQLVHFRGSLEVEQLALLKYSRDWLASRPKIELPQQSTLRTTDIPISELTAKKSDEKYESLQNWLKMKKDSGSTKLRVTFLAIELLLKEPLPSSAREHQSWWANDYRSNKQSLAWLQEGWRVEDVDLSAEDVIFQRSNAVLYQLFFADLLERLKAIRSGITNAKKTQQQPFWWFGAGKTGFNFEWIFTKSVLRTELGINIPNNRDATKKAFDALFEQRTTIEKEFGQPLVWERLEGKESRISLVRQATVNDLPAELEQTKKWAVEIMLKFVDVFQERIKKL
ncbi:MAG: hypothetical protein NVS4B7_12290 [Ktedonobacteraceae bacterium]